MSTSSGYVLSGSSHCHAGARISVYRIFGFEGVHFRNVNGRAVRRGVFKANSVFAFIFSALTKPKHSNQPQWNEKCYGRNDNLWVSVLVSLLLISLSQLTQKSFSHNFHIRQTDREEKSNVGCRTRLFNRNGHRPRTHSSSHQLPGTNGSFIFLFVNLCRLDNEWMQFQLFCLAPNIALTETTRQMDQRRQKPNNQSRWIHCRG